MHRLGGLLSTRTHAAASIALAIALTGAANSGASALAVPQPSATASEPCAAVPAPEPSPPGLDGGVWLVTVRTTGGRSGLGAGNFSARSDGTIWADGCTGRIDAATLANLSGLVATTHETLWKRSYLGTGDGCCDQIEASLTLDRTVDGKKTSHGTSTISETFESTPADFRALYAAVREAAEPYGFEARQLHARAGSGGA